MSLNTIFNQPAIIDELAMLINGTPAGSGDVYIVCSGWLQSYSSYTIPLTVPIIDASVFSTTAANAFISYDNTNTYGFIFNQKPKATDAYLITFDGYITMAGTGVSTLTLGYGVNCSDSGAIVTGGGTAALTPGGTLTFNQQCSFSCTLSNLSPHAYAQVHPSIAIQTSGTITSLVIAGNFSMMKIQ